MAKPKKAAPSRRPAPQAMQLLCATDFSPNARRAADAATALAQRLGTALELVHVSELPAYPPLRKNLRTEADRLRKQGVVVTETLLNALPATGIVKRAEPHSHRLIVVASQGKRLPERWLLGSVSEGVAERAAVPTLVVRNATPLEAWARDGRSLKVLIAFNRTATSDAALRWAQQLEGIGPCEWVVGHVDWPPDPRSRLGIPAPMSLVGNPPKVQAALEKEVRTRAAELLGSNQFQLRIEANWGRPDIRLADMAKEEEADLIVIGSHQYHGFERLWHRSISRGLLHEASTNVLVVPLVSRQPQPEGALPPVRRVLVATDFSDRANLAVPHAYSLLGAGGTLHVVHVAHPRELPDGKRLKGPIDSTFTPRHRKRIQACTQELRRLIHPGAAARGILTEIEVCEHRDPAEGICQAAERFGADLVCVGTHGRSGLPRVLLGSVAQAVMRRSRRPVLVVRQPPE